jgi:hypothetical protein
METATNSAGEQGRILEATVPAVGATTEKKKKNQKIEISYIGGDGAETKDLGAAAAVKVITKGGLDKLVAFKDLPANVRVAALAFGLNTALRNTHNSIENAGGDGTKALESRLSGFLAGEWAAGGDGDGGVPLVIEAMVRAKTKQGKLEADMEAKWLETYRALSKEDKAKWSKTYMEKAPIALAAAEIQAERAQERLKKASAAASDSGEDF